MLLAVSLWAYRNSGYTFAALNPAFIPPPPMGPHRVGAYQGHLREATVDTAGSR